MATIRQIEANRLNAQKSTGPKTGERKERTRRNALKHGLSGAGIVLPEEEAEVVNERLGQWLSSLKPCNGYEMWLAEQVAIESVRVDTGQRDQIVLRGLQVHRAQTCWDEDRRLAAEELALRLSRAPAVVSRQLRRTPQGCDCLLERWQLLEQILVDEGSWDDAQRSLALDMLGLPGELRGRSALGGDGADALENCRAVIHREIDDLTRQRDALRNDHDDRERSAAELGLATPPSKPLEISRRYLAASLRRLQWAWGQFKKGRHDVNLDAPPPRFELGPHRQFDPSTEIIVPPRESMPARADAPPAVAEIKAPAANPEPVADPIVVDAAPVKPTELPTAPVVPTRPMSPGVPDDRLIANRHQRRAERSEARRHNSA
ncbi:MAG TPA: hypothetical protein VGZ22_12385 [Isosphaeraceae bacterium]|nr:hypothetical protein [Isosphaeraceae bacterium]